MSTGRVRGYVEACGEAEDVKIQQVIPVELPELTGRMKVTGPKYFNQVERQCAACASTPSEDGSRDTSRNALRGVTGIHPTRPKEVNMQRNAQAAYTVLKAAGLHLMQNNGSMAPLRDQSRIQSTSTDGSPARKLPVYWAGMAIFDMDGSQALNDLLDKHGLYFEWVNAGVIVYSVYDQ